RRSPPQAGPATRLASLIYQDAYEVIGGGPALSLEDVVLNCVRWGSPTPGSIGRIFDEVYDRLGRLPFGRGDVVGPGDDTTRKLLRRLDGWLKTYWQDGLVPRRTSEPERLSIRRSVFGQLSRRSELFLDPYDYLASVVSCDRYVPRLLVGCAH